MRIYLTGILHGFDNVKQFCWERINYCVNNANGWGRWLIQRAKNNILMSVWTEHHKHQTCYVKCLNNNLHGASHSSRNIYYHRSKCIIGHDLSCLISFYNVVIIQWMNDAEAMHASRVIFPKRTTNMCSWHYPWKKMVWHGDRIQYVTNQLLGHRELIQRSLPSCVDGVVWKMSAAE